MKNQPKTQTSMNTKFIDYVIAKITGDKEKALAYKNEKLATAAIKGQISAQESAIVHAEIALETAQEKFANTITSVTTDGKVKAITNSEAYIEAIAEAKYFLDEAEKSLAKYKEDKLYFENLLKEYFN